MASSTTEIMLTDDPGLMVERWANALMELLLVPPLVHQASLFIHRRELSLYRRLRP